MPHAVSSAVPSLPAPTASLPRARLARLCVAVQGATAAELLGRAEAVLKDAHFLEFRLDSLAKPPAALPQLRNFLATHRDVTAIATCRRKQSGGSFTGSLKAELEILLEAAEGGCQIVDLEVESAEEAGKAQLAQFRDGLRAAGAALLVSFHDFTRTKALDQAARRIEAFEPEFVKVVSTARTLADNLAVLRLIEDRSLSAQIVAIAMGEEGILAASWAREAALRSPLPRLPMARRPLRARSPRARCVDLYRVGTARPGNTHLRRRRQSHRPLAFSAACTTPRFNARSVNAVHAAAQGQAPSTTCSP